MGSVTAEVQINKPATTVYKFLADTSNWHKTDDSVIDVTPKGPVSKGSKGTETRKMGGRTIEGTWVITDLVPDRKIAMDWAGPGMSGTGTNEIEGSGANTRLKFSMTYKTKGLMMWLMAPMIKREFNKTTGAMMQKTKASIEAASM
jgi:carbon monoxide dehydrogenase subunit G